MNSLFLTSVMGIVEGLTEFLPISSTGHLIITRNLMGYMGHTREHATTIEIVIQFGAISAVIMLYWRRFVGLLVPKTVSEYMEFSGVRGLWLLFLTILPTSVLGLFASKAIKFHLFNPLSVALALAVGAMALLLVEALPHKNQVKSLDNITPALALGIGLFQCLALWPGFSRAGATMIGAMMLGASRKIAVEYSYLAAVPMLALATLYDLCTSWNHLNNNDLGLIAIGFMISFIVAKVTVKVFIRLLGHVTLRPFAWYRLVLAPAIWIYWS